VRLVTSHRTRAAGGAPAAVQVEAFQGGEFAHAVRERLQDLAEQAQGGEV